MGPGPLFHIGYHRTATTWFQEVFYPAARNGQFVPRDLVRETIIGPRAFDFDPKIARSSLAGDIPPERLLACEENLSGYIHNGGLGGLVPRAAADRLHAAFPEARIVIMLRAQPSVIAASYAQYVRGGGTWDMEHYLGVRKRSKGAAKYWYKAPVFDFDHFRYGPLLAYYRNLFGRGQMHVWLYEEFRNNQREFLRRFCASLDIDVDVASLPIDKVNASLDPHRIRILRRLNLFTARSVQNKLALADLKGWYGRRWTFLEAIARVWRAGSGSPATLQLPDHVGARMAELYGVDNSQVAAQWDLPLAEHGYPLEGQQHPSMVRK